MDENKELKKPNLIPKPLGDIVSNVSNNPAKELDKEILEEEERRKVLVKTRYYNREISTDRADKMHNDNGWGVIKSSGYTKYRR